MPVIMFPSISLSSLIGMYVVLAACRVAHVGIAILK